MTQVNMHEAKSNLSRLVESLESGRESEVTISRNGRPIVKMTLIKDEKPKRKFGFAKGRFAFDYEAFQALDKEVQALFDESIENDIRRGF
jgi:antitoxin (DNA-binding transcriptional repressor) of toxin-antitoxin stability system